MVEGCKTKIAKEELDLNKKVVKEFWRKKSIMSSITADSRSHTPTGWKRWAYSTNIKILVQCI